MLIKVTKKEFIHWKILKYEYNNIGVIKKRFLGGVLLGIFIHGIFVSVFTVDFMYLLQSLADGAAVSQCVFAAGEPLFLRVG